LGTLENILQKPGFNWFKVLAWEGEKESSRETQGPPTPFGCNPPFEMTVGKGEGLIRIANKGRRKLETLKGGISDPHYGNPLAGGDALAVGWDHNETVGARGTDDVAGTMPPHQLNFSMFELAAQ
jgi:hypothetical protein